MLEDEWLKWKFRRGSREALARIYEKCRTDLLKLAVSLVTDVHATVAKGRTGGGCGRNSLAIPAPSETLMMFLFVQQSRT